MECVGCGRTLFPAFDDDGDRGVRCVNVGCKYYGGFIYPYGKGNDMNNKNPKMPDFELQCLIAEEEVIEVQGLIEQHNAEVVAYLERHERHHRELVERYELKMSRLRSWVHVKEMLGER